jgi:hypothetical protein
VASTALFSLTIRLSISSADGGNVNLRTGLKLYAGNVSQQGGKEPTLYYRIAKQSEQRRKPLNCRRTDSNPPRQQPCSIYNATCHGSAASLPSNTFEASSSKALGPSWSLVALPGVERAG